MVPTDSISDFPDIVLTISQDLYREIKGTLESLEFGDRIRFKGVISHMGDEFSYHIISLIEINKLEGRIEIE